MPYSGRSSCKPLRSCFVFPRLGFITKGLSVQTDLCFLEAQLIWLLHCGYLLILYKHSAKFKVPLLLLSLHHCDFFYFKWFINVFQILRPDCHMWTKELFLRYEKDLKGTVMLSNVSYNRLGSPKTHYLWGIFLVFFNCSQTPQWRCWKTYLRHYSCMTS